MSFPIEAPFSAASSAAWGVAPTPRKDRAEATPESVAPENVAGKSEQDPLRKKPWGQEGGAGASSLLRTPQASEGRGLSPDGIQRLEEDRMKKRIGLEPCETCANRRYQDESGDGSVSFQSPTPIAPEATASAVRAHENEHVRNEQVYAQQEGREVVSQSVRLFTSVCPECGRTYVSGGETRTTTASAPSRPTSSPPGNPFELVA